jgi:C_GCAxxG_C_C family probable redox protein
MSDPDFDFDTALAATLAALDIGAHCSCAEITAEMLSRAIPLQRPGMRCAAAGFGGGVMGNGSVCGAFAAGLIALGTVVGERDDPPGCISETIGAAVQAYYDEWVERHGSVYCSDLTGHASLRDDRVRDEFFAGGGPQHCTDNYIRFAVERILATVAVAQPG